MDETQADPNQADVPAPSQALLNQEDFIERGVAKIRAKLEAAPRAQPHWADLITLAATLMRHMLEDGPGDPPSAQVEQDSSDAQEVAARRRP